MNRRNFHRCTSVAMIKPQISPLRCAPVENDKVVLRKSRFSSRCTAIHSSTTLSSRPEESWVRGSPKVMKKRFGPATTLSGTVALSFVIPSVPGFPTSELSAAPLMWFSLKENHMQLTEAATLDRKSGEAEGSAVPRTTTGKAEYDAQTELSSRPERSGVERS